MRKNSPSSARPFPWKCFHCGKTSVSPGIVPYTAEVNHDGRIYTFTIQGLKTPVCKECKTVFPDDEANRQISDRFRLEARLLFPRTIRQNREALQLTQKQFASALGVAEATVSRWETGGQIQQRSLDGLIRLFFEYPQVRSALMNEEEMPHLGLEVKPFPSSHLSESLV